MYDVHFPNFFFLIRAQMLQMILNVIQGKNVG